MKALVTGSTGLLGNNLVRELLGAGWEVRALARSRQRADGLLGDTRAEIVTGDMEDVAGFSSALDGVDAVFHTAAYFREYYQTTEQDAWRQLKAINIDATLELIDAAQQRGVGTFVHTSSSGVYGVPASGPADEQTPPDDYVYRNLYFRSKLEGDQAIAQRLPGLTMKLVTMHPVGMLGPRDSAPTGFGGAIISALNGRLPVMVPGAVAVVDARDVAAAMVSAAHKAPTGAHYLVSNSLQSLSNVINMARREVGMPPLRVVPYPMAVMMALGSQTLSRITQRPPMVTMSTVEVLQHTPDFTMEKAARELGARVRPLEETIRDEVRWYIEHGYVEGRVASAAA